MQEFLIQNLKSKIGSVIEICGNITVSRRLKLVLILWKPFGLGLIWIMIIALAPAAVSALLSTSDALYQSSTTIKVLTPVLW
jgi:hypothetical protein